MEKADSSLTNSQGLSAKDKHLLDLDRLEIPEGLEEETPFDAPPKQDAGWHRREYTRRQREKVSK